MLNCSIPFYISWEQRKLGDVAKINMGQSPDGANYTTNPKDAILVQGNADMSDGWVLPRVYTKQITKQAHVGDLIFSVRAPVGEVGKTQYNVVIGRGVAAISGNEFIFQSLKRMNSLGYWTKLAAGSTFESINSDTLKAAEFAIPKKNEQAKIGEILLKIDNLITLHQRKQNKQISGALSKKCYIKIANSWEQREAETLFISYAEKGFPDLPVLSATQDKGMVFRDDEGKIVFHDKTNEIGYKRVQPGQFVIHLRSFQGGFAHSNILGITSPAYTIFGFKEGEKQYDLFWKCIFSSPDFIRRLESVTYGIRDGRSISYDEFLTMKFIIPEYNEQVKIATHLIKTDNLITLHQRKHFAFYISFFSCLESFEKCKKTNSWEQRKLSETVNEVTRTDAESTAPVMMITANNGFIEQSDRYAFDNAGESLKKYILLEKGELAYNHGASKLRPYGSCFALTTVEKARIPFVYHCFSVKNQNPEFLSIELNGENVEKQLRRIVSSGARMDGLLNISFKEYASVELSLPQVKEQNKISSCFCALDNLITLHQRKFKDFHGGFL